MNNHVNEILDEHLGEVAECEVCKLIYIDFFVEENLMIMIFLASIKVIEFVLDIGISET